MNKTRPKTILIRLSQEEYHLIKTQIKDSGMTQQDWILSKLLVSEQSDITGDITVNADGASPKQTKNGDEKICPQCGRPLIPKNGRRGKFWGCSNFPNCRYTEDWKQGD